MGLKPMNRLVIDISIRPLKQTGINIERIILFLKTTIIAVGFNFVKKIMGLKPENWAGDLFIYPSAWRSHPPGKADGNN
jgi:hypothetical protein